MHNRWMHLILLWRLNLNERHIQSPDGYLWWSFFIKTFKGWLIITLSCEKMPAQVLLSQHLLVQSQERKAQKNLWKLFKVNNKDTRATSINVVQASSFLTLNRIYTLFWYLHRWLWTSKFWLGQTCNFIKNIFRQSS